MGLLDSLQVKVKEQEKKEISVSTFDEQIDRVEQEIRVQFQELGQIYYLHHSEDYTEEYAPQIKKLRSLDEEKKIITKNKLAAQGLRLCEECQQIIPLDSAFCNKCGAKLEAVEISTAGGKYCPLCGTLLNDGDLFCVSCGAKISG